MKGWAIVTGAGRGIGRATSIRLAADGYSVAILDIHKESLDETSALLTGNGSFKTAVIDITKKENVQQVVAELEKTSQPITALANVAGLVARAPMLELDRTAYDKVNDVNIHGTLQMMQTVIPSMIRTGGGAVVNFASMAAFAARPTQPHYAAGKAAIVSLTKSAATTFIDGNVRVNAIAPGLIDTDMWTAGGRNMSGFNDEEAINKFMADRLARLPIKRVGDPREIASVVSFLLSSDASFIVGQTINVCGGQSAVDVMSS